MTQVIFIKSDLIFRRWNGENYEDRDHKITKS